MNWLPSSAVVVSSWQMLRRGRSPNFVVEFVSCRVVEIHILRSVAVKSRFECSYCILEYLLWPGGNAE